MLAKVVFLVFYHRQKSWQRYDRLLFLDFYHRQKSWQRYDRLHIPQPGIANGKKKRIFLGGCGGIKHSAHWAEKLFFGERVRESRPLHWQAGVFCFVLGLLGWVFFTMLVIFFQGKIFCDFRFSFPRESSFLQWIPGSDIQIYTCRILWLLRNFPV